MKTGKLPRDVVGCVEDHLLCYEDVWEYESEDEHFYGWNSFGFESEDEAKLPTSKEPVVCPICYETTSGEDLVALMKGCQHEPACRACLRRIFVTHAQESVQNYPLQCFHPDCSLAVRDTQLIRHKLVRSDEELTRHYRLTELAKERRGAELLHCPKCDHPHGFYGESPLSGRLFSCRQCGEPVFMEFQRQEFNPVYFEHIKSIGHDVAKSHRGRTQCRGCCIVFKLKSPSRGLDQIVACPGCQIRFFVASKSTVIAVEVLELEDLVEAGLGQCPDCSAILFKNRGCDHMVCLCGAQFGWKSVQLRPSKLRDILSALMA